MALPLRRNYGCTKLVSISPSISRCSSCISQGTTNQFDDVNGISVFDDSDDEDFLELSPPRSNTPNTAQTSRSASLEITEPPFLRKSLRQDDLIQAVTAKLQAHADLTCGQETASYSHNIILKVDDTTLWMRVWQSARVAQQARVSSRSSVRKAS